MKFLVFQHTATEPLGHLEPVIRSHKIELDIHPLYQNPELPPVENYDALIVMGGPFHVDEEEKYPFLKAEKQAIRTAVEKKIPYLGICLGGQLLARAMGARVPKNKVPEIGYYDITLTDDGARDPLFAGVPLPLRMIQWHFDTFDVPPGAALLATTPTCRHQAIRVGKNAYGIQFHFEVDEKLATRWVNHSRPELAALTPPTDGQEIIAEAAARRPEMEKTCVRIFENFLGTF